MRAKSWLNTSIVLALIYVGYILWAKFAKVIGEPPVRLSETGEFLLFLAAVVAFTIEIFVEDAGTGGTQDDEAREQ